MLEIPHMVPASQVSCQWHCVLVAQATSAYSALLEGPVNIHCYVQCGEEGVTSQLECDLEIQDTSPSAAQ